MPYLSEAWTFWPRKEAAGVANAMIKATHHIQVLVLPPSRLAEEYDPRSFLQRRRLPEDERWRHNRRPVLASVEVLLLALRLEPEAVLIERRVVEMAPALNALS